MTTVRQRIAKLKDFATLDKIAVMGDWSASSNDTDTLPDVSYKVVFADSGNISAGATKDCWGASSDMDYPTSAEVLDIVSSSIQDDIGGSGTDAVFIEGLDGDYSPISELVILDGTTTVNSTKSYVHVSEINCLNITTSGTTNAGNITITNTTSGQNLGYVNAGDSISEHGQLVVPAGYNAIMITIEASVFRTSGTGVRRAELDLIFKPLDGGAGDRIEYKTIRFGVSSEGGVSEIHYDIPIVIGSRVALIPRATAEANNTEVAAQYAVLLVKETVDIDTLF